MTSGIGPVSPYRLQPLPFETDGHPVGSQRRYNLLWVCFRTLRWPLLMTVPPRLCLLGFTIFQPLILNRFLRFLQTPSDDVRVGYGLIGAYFLVYFGMSLAGSFYNHRASRAVTMLRGVLVSAVFAKTTEIPATTDNGASVTLMSTDVSTTAIYVERRLTRLRSIKLSALFGKCMNSGRTPSRSALLPGC